MLPPQNENQVFLSYAAADRERALAIADALEQAGVPVWIDRRSIAGGDLWAAGIAQAIRGCAALAILCTPASVASRNVRQELQLAWDYDRPIFPLLLEPVSFPDEIAYFVHGRQWIELLDPSDSTWVEAVAHAISSGKAQTTAATNDSPSDLARPGSTGTRASGIPTPPTPLIGREPELAAIMALVREHPARLITLTGPGGVGKTRLALEIASSIAVDFPDGATFVDLGPLTDATLILPAIASAAGLREIGDRPLFDVLTGFFGTRRYLLLLDNFEHLMPGAAEAAALVRECPNLQILVTSREPLRVRGEREVQIAPLSVPNRDRPASLEHLRANESMALFVSRANDVRPDFTLDEANAPRIAEICRQLDGLPLAIELAAARIRLLSPAALLDRLGQRLGLLTEGARDAPDRQQTLRNTIAWSYDLLSPVEQAFFRRASVFVNGFMLDGAAAIAGLPACDPLDVVTSLVEKSLIRTVQLEGETRFWMLESIRAFGLERLEEHDEVAATRQAHLAYVLSMIEAFDADGHYEGIAERWFGRVDAELENVRGAFSWAQHVNDGDSLIRLGAEMGGYWTSRPFTIEAISLLKAGIVAAPEASSRLQVISRYCAGMLMASVGDQDGALDLAENALAIAELDGDNALQGLAHCLMAGLWETAGDCERSARSYRAAVDALRPTPDVFWLHLATGELGDRLVVCGDIEEAVALFTAAETGYRSHQSLWGLAILPAQRANAEIARGHLDLARQLFAESIAASRTIGDLRIELGAVLGFASIELELGHPEQAARIIGVAQREREAHGIGRKLAHPLSNERTDARVQAALGDDRYRACVQEGRAISYGQLLSLILPASESTGTLAGVPAVFPTQMEPSA